MRRFAPVDEFQRIAQCYAQSDLRKLLGIGRRTLKRWLEGRTRIPWTAYQLAYERSHYGLAERDAAEGFNRTVLLQLNAALHERLANLERELASQARLIDWGCANDPFISPHDPRTVKPAH